ncbi:hypothetical protein [Mesorhizobium sp.]|uniref:hypothetical protein n=1 Tax=Mesorhizobium sp. TaxID=1871066 RepID=UPI0011F48CFB|nr:hypothetical protein [Mesorhizobium sp.]TIO72239.1 MAG: hypothetical protein E5X75_33375 [Mesorhizobium sp.]
MNIRAILEAKAKAFAEHDGVVTAAVTHLIAAANEVVLEVRREMDALIAGLAPAPAALTPVADQSTAEAAQSLPEPEPAPESQPADPKPADPAPASIAQEPAPASTEIAQ